MTEVIRRRKFNRFVILNELYNLVSGDTSKWVDISSAASAKGIVNDQFKEAFHYLRDEGLIKLYGAGYSCYISHTGVKAVEFTHCNPNKESEYFDSLSDMGL